MNQKIKQFGIRTMLLWLLSGSCCLTAGATGVRMRHDIVLKGGWNAIYLPVTPDQTPDELFADWPTDKVGCYDPESYLRTAQFTASAADSTQGAISPHMRLWVRGVPARTTLTTVLGDAIYIVNNTNASEFVKTVYGEPRAMRAVWHATVDGTVPVNYLGVSTDGEDADLTPEGYLAGLDTGWIGRWSVGGRGTLVQPKLLDMLESTTAPNGSAVALDALKAGDWSGPLRVSPALGFDLGTNGTMGVLKVRNDSGTNRVVRVFFHEGQGGTIEDPDGTIDVPVEPGGFPTVPCPQLLYLDLANHAEWQTNGFRAHPYERELVAGETLELHLAVDRENELFGEAGMEYGGIVTVTDVSPENCSHFQTSVPFSATSDGGEFRRTKWPKGLWVADLTLDKVAQTFSADRRMSQIHVSTNVNWEISGSDPPVTNRVESVVTNSVEVLFTDPIKAGAPMKLRMLVHVDYNGALTLMQRARIGGRRVSAAALPVDRPLITGQGEFGVSASFNWSVGENSRVNPFYHARHPDHDGLLADFETPAPSGDDFNNYNSTVKPELFSIANTLTLAWDATTGAAWDPQEVLSGTCTWTFEGLRREGALETSGVFTMKRISTLDVNELKEDL